MPFPNLPNSRVTFHCTKVPVEIHPMKHRNAMIRTFEPATKNLRCKGGCDWPTKIKHDNIRELRLFVELKKRNVRSSMDITTSLATCQVVWPNS